MISITADKIKDFQMCALLYDLRHNDGNPAQLLTREIRQAKYDETIKKVVSFFFYKKQSNAEPSYNALLNRWEKLWFPKGTTAMDLVTSRHEIAWQNETSYTTQAAAALLAFYEDFADQPKKDVLLLNEPFVVPLNKDVKLEGSFDLILREGPSTFHLYKWSGYHKRISAAQFNIDFAILDYAFRYRNNFKPVLLHFHAYDFCSTKPGDILFEVTEQDSSSVEFWTNQIRETEVFAPRRGLTSYCKRCEFWEDDRCKNFSYLDHQEKVTK